MDPHRIAVAEACLAATFDGSLSFPEIIRKLVAAGFEGYAVDYRRHAQTCYLPDGDNVDLALPDAVEVKDLIRWAQAAGADYTYKAFCQKVTAAGCAGYLVSFLGRRVVYYGRTGATHVEVFPQ